MKLFIFISIVIFLAACAFLCEGFSRGIPNEASVAFRWSRHVVWMFRHSLMKDLMAPLRILREKMIGRDGSMTSLAQGRHDAVAKSRDGHA